MTEYERFQQVQQDPAFRAAVKAARRLIDTLPESERCHVAISVAAAYDGVAGLERMVREGSRT